MLQQFGVLICQMAVKSSYELQVDKKNKRKKEKHIMCWTEEPLWYNLLYRYAFNTLHVPYLRTSAFLSLERYSVVL